MSYITQAQSSDPDQLSAGNKRFDISRPHHLLACPSSHVSNMWSYSNSCYSVYRKRPAVNILERDSSWHHLAVTAAPDGTIMILIKTYKDGLLMTEVNLALVPVHAGQLHTAPQCSVRVLCRSLQC